MQLKEYPAPKKWPCNLDHTYFENKAIHSLNDDLIYSAVHAEHGFF